MNKDNLYKLKKIKYHRLVNQITKDVTDFIYKYTDETLNEFLSKKYPGVIATVGYDETNVYNINVTIPKPIEFIDVKFTISNNINDI